jgi:hypothetical protein
MFFVLSRLNQLFNKYIEIIHSDALDYLIHFVVILRKKFYQFDKTI